MRFISENKCVRWSNRYFRTVGILLFFIALIRTICLLGNHECYLYTPDPLFIKFSSFSVILATVIFEVAIAISLFLVHSIKTRVLLILWLSSLFTVYRIGVWIYFPTWVSCSCRGFFSKWLKISEQTVDQIAFSILLFMIVGSLLVLTLHYISKKVQVEGGSK
jgi:hypothetical protein